MADIGETLTSEARDARSAAELTLEAQRNNTCVAALRRAAPRS